MARMAKTVAARDLKSLVVRRPGSSPGARTILLFCLTMLPLYKDTLTSEQMSLSYIDWETYIDMNREPGDME